METVTDFIFFSSKITTDGDCHYEIKGHLLLGRKAMSNLDSILKSRDFTLLTKIHLAKALVFPIVMYVCESWTVKKAECLKNWYFLIVVWRRLLRIPLNSKEIQRVNPKGNQHWMFHWKDWGWSWTSNTLATWCEKPIHWKRPWYWEELKARGEGVTEDEEGGWHHWLSGHEFGQTLGGNEGQKSMACCSPWCHKEFITTHRLNNKSDWSSCILCSSVDQ